MNYIKKPRGNGNKHRTNGIPITKIGGTTAGNILCGWGSLLSQSLKINMYLKIVFESRLIGISVRVPIYVYKTVDTINLISIFCGYISIKYLFKYKE